MDSRRPGVGKPAHCLLKVRFSIAEVDLEDGATCGVSRVQAEEGSDQSVKLRDRGQRAKIDTHMLVFVPLDLPVASIRSPTGSLDACLDCMGRCA